MSYIRVCKHCGKEFEASWYNVMTCPECKRSHEQAWQKKYRETHKAEIAEKKKARLASDPEYKKKNSENFRRWWREKHPIVDRFCLDCGKMLSGFHALRCQECAAVRHKLMAKKNSQEKRDRLRAERKIKKQEAKTVLSSSSNKKAMIITKKASMQKDLDARRKVEAEKKRQSAQEKKRVAAGVAMMKEIMARRQAEKRRAMELREKNSCEYTYGPASDMLW